MTQTRTRISPETMEAIGILDRFAGYDSRVLGEGFQITIYGKGMKRIAMAVDADFLTAVKKAASAAEPR